MSGTFNITLLSCIVCLVGSYQFLELILLLLGENKVLEVHLAITINFRNIHKGINGISLFNVLCFLK